METNSTIFYTTAQVTEMVDLSDQNVRKYVRLLEDRNYEVAKDEHNRRLFSGDDVEILRELIKLSKQPGYTLETAADQLANNASNGVVNSQTRMPAVGVNNEFTELLTSVVKGMDDMRREQNELKKKMDLLISKLEQTSSTFEKNLITHEEIKASEEMLAKSTEESVMAVEPETEIIKEPVEDSTDDMAKDIEQGSPEKIEAETLSENNEAGAEENAESTEDIEKFEADKRQNEARIDMTKFENNPPKETSDAQSAENTNKEEKGAFGRFLDFFKGK